MSVDIPQVPPGEDILATIDFYAINPGAWYWATFLIADIPALGVQRLLDKARETGEEGGRQKTYNLGRMPDGNVAISLFLFAHDDAAYDWSWGEYYVWLDGYTVEITHLDSRYVFLTPGVIPPEELDFDLAKPIPSKASVVPGTAITLTCPVTSRCPGAVHASVKVIIYEGSVWPAHGDKITEYDSGVFPINPNETRSLIFSHVAVAGTIDRRDVQVEVYVDGQLVKESEWDDVYYVTEAPPEYNGTITRVELEYDGTKRTAPVDDVPLDSRGLIHVSVRNDTEEAQRMGIRWEVHDPQGRLVDAHDEWETWPYTVPYDTHEFIGGRFDLVEQGNYTIGVTLFMNPDAPVAVDTYSGRLCTVGVEVPPPPPPPCEQYQTEEECVAAGCYWYDNSCHLILEEEVKKFPWLPVALIGGGAVVAIVAAKPKKPKP